MSGSAASNGDRDGFFAELARVFNNYQPVSSQFDISDLARPGEKVGVDFVTRSQSAGFKRDASSRILPTNLGGSRQSLESVGPSC